MEIPYNSKPRPDTGLYNAKVGIWLFLASEVMLFGALFSSYILLRIGADPGKWPHGLLNVPLGMVNTLVLICSSVTVVLAWASLKSNNFGKYKMLQAITIVCALIFMCIKSYEYHDKFTHYYVKLKDGKEYNGHIEGNPMLWNLAKVKAKNLSEIKFSAETPQEEAAHASSDAKDAHAHEHDDKDAHKDHADHAHDAAPAAAGHGGHTEVLLKTEDIQKLECYGPWHSTYLAIYFTLTGLHALHVIGGALVIFMIWGPLSGMWKTDPTRYVNRVEVSGLFWHLVDLVWIFLFPVLYLL